MQVGDAMPEVVLVDDHGRPWRLADQHGRPVVLLLHRHLA